MSSSHDHIAIIESPGYGLRGDAPSGDYVPPPIPVLNPGPSLRLLDFNLPNGSPAPAPLVPRAGTFEVRNNQLFPTGNQPAPAIGWLIGADTGMSDGIISATYFPNGSDGNETGIMIRYRDNENFIDCVNLNGTLALVHVENNAPVATLGTYAIPNYDPNVPPRGVIRAFGESIEIFCNGVLAISATLEALSTETVWGFKYAGLAASMGNLLLPNAAAPIIDNSHYYVAGHSLFTYDGGDAAPNTDYTRAGTWIGLFAAESSTQASGAAEFGQITTINTNWADNGVPVGAQLAYSSNSYDPWPSGSFADQDFDQLIFMASNFEQETETPQSYLPRVLTLIDNVRGEEPLVEAMMYVHWPESNLAGSFGDVLNLTSAEWATYNTYSRGDYLDWHVAWFNEILAARPNLKLRVMPVYPVIADMLENLPVLSSVVWTDLMGDSSPHGTETMYLLCGLVSYICMYSQAPDLDNFSVPAGATQVIGEVANNLPAIVTYAADRLNYYNNNGIKVY